MVFENPQQCNTARHDTIRSRKARDKTAVMLPPYLYRNWKEGECRAWEEQGWDERERSPDDRLLAVAANTSAATAAAAAASPADGSASWPGKGPIVVALVLLFVCLLRFSSVSSMFLLVNTIAFPGYSMSVNSRVCTVGMGKGKESCVLLTCKDGAINRALCNRNDVLHYTPSYPT